MPGSSPAARIKSRSQPILVKIGLICLHNLPESSFEANWILNSGGPHGPRNNPRPKG